MKFKVKRWIRKDTKSVWINIGTRLITISGYGDNTTASIGNIRLLHVFDIKMTPTYLSFCGFTSDPIDGYYYVRCYNV